jgi:hypothetical protein
VSICTLSQANVNVRSSVEPSIILVDAPNSTAG